MAEEGGIVLLFPSHVPDRSVRLCDSFGIYEKDGMRIFLFNVNRPVGSMPCNPRIVYVTFHVEEVREKSDLIAWICHNGSFSMIGVSRCILCTTPIFATVLI
ncbi:hypothetical protein ES702_00121 [subsurface metagenome]